MARTSNLQDFNKGTICGQETTYGSHAWSGGPFVAATLGPGGPIMGDHRLHDRTNLNNWRIKYWQVTYLYICIATTDYKNN